MDRIVNLDIPAKPEFVVLCRLALAGVLRDQGYSDEAVADLKLALTEACSNSIRHAYPSLHSSPGSVHVSYRVSDDRIVLMIRDEGDGFSEDVDDLQPLPDGTVIAGEGGMGISLIKAVVDEFRLEQPNGGGSCLILTKLRDS